MVMLMLMLLLMMVTMVVTMMVMMMMVGDVVSLHLCPSFVPILASLLNGEETSNVCRERST